MDSRLRGNDSEDAFAGMTAGCLDMENPLKKGYTQAGWIPAFAGRTVRMPARRSTPRLEEHLASWTKGCEGQKGSGEGR
ncbi:hypothetical protein SMC1_08680 [Candidatus Cryosericum septentrionale]|jgi:hypothetical protein|uniref:Uncharacterized protein n=1 Tax=Candidatus Cryosericum septentrionale TaxID=2290913 RepID=A0A398DQ20_9BACT|nr:hypothetical protein SMC1_08680 [Candidatus Cryosericum septentrionale]